LVFLIETVFSVRYKMKPKKQLKI